MLTEIAQMTDFYKISVIEEYNLIVMQLLELLDQINVFSNVYLSNAIILRDNK